MRRVSWITAGAVGLLCALLGLVGWTAGKHLWQDHLALHELAVIEMRRQQQGVVK